MRQIFKAKHDHKSKLEYKVVSSDLGFFWAFMKTISGLQNRKSISLAALDLTDAELANALYHFTTALTLLGVKSRNWNTKMARSKIMLYILCFIIF